MNFIQSNTFNYSILLASRTFDLIDQKISSLVNNKSKRSLAWIIVICACFSIILLLNIFTPLTADDFGYQYIFGTNRPVSSLSDIIESQYYHYYMWGGRSVVHFIAQTLLLLPPLMIDVVNSLVYILYSFLIYYMIRGYKEGSILLFILINLMTWLIQPAFADTILWITGSANYLWGTTIILLFLLPYRFYNGQRKKGISNILYAILFFFFSILAGWTNENTAGAMLMIVLLFLLYYRSNKWRIPYWTITGLIGALIGYVVMIIAPGNTERAGDAALVGAFIVCYRIFTHTLTLIENYGMIILFYLIILSLFWHFTKQNRENTLKLSLIFMISAFAGIYAMIFSPAFPPRAWFGILTFMFISIGIIFYNLDYRYKFLREIRLSVLIIASIAFLISIVPITRDIYHFYNVNKERQVQVNKAKKNGETTCEFERYVANSRFVHTEEILSKHLLSQYYGIEITFKKIPTE